MRAMLKSKIHRAHVTGANVDYEGSITIDTGLLEAADILPYEKVQIVDIHNGERFETYAIEGARGSGEICLNGAAARLAAKGDTIIILTFSYIGDEEARAYEPKIVHVDANNAIVDDFSRIMLA